MRPAWAEIDLGAIRHNARVLGELAAPARLCAVVKARGYGHGAVEAPRAAVEGGAAWLAVALVEEGLELRAAGLSVPILLLSQPTPAAMPEVVDAALTPTVYTPAGLTALGDAVRSARLGSSFPVHVKVDTGMHRVGANPEAAVELAVAVQGDAALALDGFWTHLAVSEELDNPYTAAQLDRFDATLERLAHAGVRPPLRHAANSGAAMWHPASRYDLVRCGIALYGLGPAGDGEDREPVPRLRPAMALKGPGIPRAHRGGGRAALLRAALPPRPGLGDRNCSARLCRRRHPGLSPRPVVRCCSAGCGGRSPGPSPWIRSWWTAVRAPRWKWVTKRCSWAGRAAEEITAWEWANRIGTIAYEVVCAVSGRVPRIYLQP